MPGDVGTHRIHVDIEETLQRVQGRLQILLFAQQQLSVQNDVVNLVAHRQHRAVCVHNLPTLKRYYRRVILLMRQYLFLVLLPVIPVDQKQPDTESCKSCQNKQKQHKQFFLHFYCKFHYGTSSTTQKTTCLFVLRDFRHLLHIVAVFAGKRNNLTFPRILHAQLLDRDPSDLLQIHGTCNSAVILLICNL